MGFDRNTVLAFALALLILLGWEYFYAPKTPPKPPADTTAVATPAAPPAAPGVDGKPESGALTEQAAEDTAAQPEKRIHIATPHLHGSLTLKGGRIDDITLVQYHETLDPKSPEIVLFSPTTEAKPYYAEAGWITNDPSVAVPGPTTLWTAESSAEELTDTAPLVLSWNNGQGLKFKRTISLDANYLFTIEQTVENAGEKPVTLYPYALIARIGTPTGRSVYFSHEGPLGVFDRVLKEQSYSDLQKQTRIAVDSTGGWIGFTDKYWLGALAFDQSLKVNASFNHAMAGTKDRYQSDMRGEPVTAAPGEAKTVKAYVFVGAKELQLLDAYSENPGITRFDLAIDFGWYYFLTKPFFLALRWLHGVLGNFGLAIIAFSTFIRLLMFPIANRQYKSMNNMKRLQPQVKALQERHANDRSKLNVEMMELYKREKVNPLTGCLPIVIQIPIFFALYKVLYVTIEMRQAPFYGWIHDLSAADPTSVLNLFGLLPYSIPASLAFVSIGVWPLIYGITMFLQQRLNPAAGGDPTTQRIMMYMPLIFTFVLASQPVGLVIYWAWGNMLAILQQTILLRRAGIKT